MKRLPFVVLVLAVSAVVVTVCIAQQPKAPAPKPSPFIGPSPAPAVKDRVGAWPVAAATEEAAQAVEAIDPEVLRSQLLELIKQKLDMMTAEELRAALSQTEQELQEIQASHALLEAKHILQDIVQNHPKTRAARQAQTILANWEPPNDSFRLQ
jgi:hypothetical protein